jgi:imidazolonepropionase-like amidohydrolase
MRTLISDVRLVDGRSDDARGNVDVWIRGDRIDEVLPTGHAEPGASDTHLPGSGLTVLPGLIDCHVHYTFDPRIADWEAPEGGDLDVAAVAIREAGHALSAGVTTARSAGAQRNLDFWLRDAIERDLVQGPRLLAAGKVIGITGGHGHLFGHEADSDAELVKAVRAQIRDGADVIKVMASEAAMLTTTGLRPGRQVRGRPELGERQIRIVVDEAHRWGRRVLAHAQDSDAVSNAVRAGVDSVEHAFLADRATLELMASCGTTLVPTLAVTDVNRHVTDMTAEQRARQDDIEVSHRISCETAVELGIPIATGTDTGELGVFGHLLPREVALLHDHGMSPMDAVKSATSVAAALLGLDDRLGVVEPGKLADLVAVAGDPLQDLALLSTPAFVMKAGRIHPATAQDGRR